MSTMESSPEPRRRGVVGPIVVGAVVGLVVAMIVVLNLHILVGLEEGYASTPAQVAEFSPVLLTADILLTVGLPVLGAIVALRAARRATPSARG